MDKYIKIFNSYVNNYKNGNIKTDIKIDHSLNVYKNAIKFLQSDYFDNSTSDIIKFIAIFHDIGRFEQIKKYDTFNDSISIDHAKLGNKVLSDNNMMDTFSDGEQKIIRTSIYNHNKISISQDISEREKLHSKIIRDIDKLDIYRVYFKYYTKKYKVSKINENIYNSIMNDTPVDYTDVKSDTDAVLLRLSWVSDINFKFTKKEIINRKYFDMFFSMLPPSELTNKIKEKIYNELSSF